MDKILVCIRCESHILSHHRGGIQCMNCGRFYDFKEPSLKANVVYTSATLNTLLRCIRSGYSINHSARRSGISLGWASEYYYRITEILGETKPLCPCGQLSTHYGICMWRAVNDPRCVDAIHRRIYRGLARNPKSIGTVWRPDPDIVLIHGERCSEKGCVFGVADPISGMCAYHRKYFDHDESLIDRSLGFEELGIGNRFKWDKEINSPLSVVGIRDAMSARLFVQSKNGSFKTEYVNQ